jgi:acetyl-CoA acyltransferase 1
MVVSSNLDELLHKNPDDVVITMAIRSPLCKAKKGGFRDTRQVSLFLPWRVTVDNRLYSEVTSF